MYPAGGIGGTLGDGLIAVERSTFISKRLNGVELALPEPLQSRQSVRSLDALDL